MDGEALYQYAWGLTTGAYGRWLCRQLRGVSRGAALEELSLLCLRFEDEGRDGYAEVVSRLYQLLAERPGARS